MSAGSFIRTAYQASYRINEFHPIRLQPETTGLVLNVGGTNIQNQGADASDLTNPISARVSGSQRGIGLNAALVRLEWGTTAPAGYDENGILTLPLLNVAIRQVADGATGTYLGEDVQVVGTTPERVA